MKLFFAFNCSKFFFLLQLEVSNSTTAASYNFVSQHETFQANMEANDDKPMAEPLNRTNKTPGRRSIPDSYGTKLFEWKIFSELKNAAKAIEPCIFC